MEYKVGDLTSGGKKIDGRNMDFLYVCSDVFIAEE